MAQGGGQQQQGRATAITWPRRASVVAGLSPAPWTVPLDWLRVWVQAEAGAGRLLPWTPVAFGVGIALYFAAEHEPVAWVAGLTATILAVAALLLRRWRGFPAMLLAAGVAAGFAAASWKSSRIAHEVLAKPLFG